ncbi:FAD-binding domain-containing protein [Gonapodya prolifera JEL478]|uniref:FAD-binding domain-containing protein n=1 Tax=Gonapodya prolifera (strain JEL478) TaxID=1344416 RepID=A0A139AC92_GONPJ|nr:FAD-binding domain-containing protein [Gonapodya prolifera JEL478]|eukprot:KXS14387.1 FAD-binding domain-containing protein [Gonapodya prolifera JEL478]
MLSLAKALVGFAILAANLKASSGASIDSLTSCLNALPGTVELYTSGSSQYEEYRDGERVRLERYPAVIFFAANVEQVQGAVKCASTTGYNVVPRSGGHSYENLGSLDGQLLLDISTLNNVTVDAASSTATVGAGIRLGNLYVALDNFGFTFTGGVCPSVGLGGHMGAGGFGFLARKWGLIADNVLSATVVDTSGNLLLVNSTSHPDLFWAIRGGGGGSYAIVVEVLLRVFPEPPVNTIVVASWDNYTVGKDAIARFQAFAPTTTENLASQILLGFGSITFLGRYLGPQSELETLLQQSGLLSVGNATVTYQNCTSLGAQAALWDSQASCQNLDALTTPTRLAATNRENAKAKSEYVTTLLPDAALQALVDRASAIPNNFGFIELAAHGGFLDTVPSNATAFPHRKGTLMLIQYVIFFDLGTIEPMNSTRYGWINDTEKALAPYVSGAHYQGYADLDVDPQTYFAGNWERLKIVKGNYDPVGLFSNPQTPGAELVPSAGQGAPTGPNGTTTTTKSGQPSAAHQNVPTGWTLSFAATLLVAVLTFAFAR